MRKQEHILVSLNVSGHVSLIVGNVFSLALLSFCKLCQKFAVISESFLKTCIALEQVSCGGTSTRLLVLHEFACICKSMIIMWSLHCKHFVNSQIQNYVLVTSVLSIK